jgi:hypothetical protein
MKRPRVTVISVMAGLAVVFVAGPAPGGAANFTEKQIKQLESGSIVKVPVKGGGYLGGKSYILLQESEKTCYNIVADLKNYYFFYDDTLIEATVVKKESGKRTVRMVYGKGPVKMTYHAKFSLNPDKYVIKFTLDRDYPNDVLDAKGFISFTRYDQDRILMINASLVKFEDKVIWKVFGKKIANGMLRLPKYVKKFLATPQANKYKGK